MDNNQLLTLMIAIKHEERSLQEKAKFFYQYQDYSVKDILNQVKNKGWMVRSCPEFCELLKKVISFSQQIKSSDLPDFQIIDACSSNLLSKVDELLVLFSLSEDKMQESHAKRIERLIQESQPLYREYHYFLIELIKESRDKIERVTRFKISKDIRAKFQNVLFHGVKLEHVQEILERGSILGYTHHRYWAEGRRYKENQPEYEDSY